MGEGDISRRPRGPGRTALFIFAGLMLILLIAGRNLDTWDEEQRRKQQAYKPAPTTSPAGPSARGNPLKPLFAVLGLVVVVPLAVLAAGLVARRERRRTREFLMAGRKVPGRLVKYGITLHGLTDICFEYEFEGRKFRRRKSVAVKVAEYLIANPDVTVIVDPARPKRCLLEAEAGSM